jgi:hypothetical protein
MKIKYPDEKDLHNIYYIQDHVKNGQVVIHNRTRKVFVKGPAGMTSLITGEYAPFNGFDDSRNWKPVEATLYIGEDQ